MTETEMLDWIQDHLASLRHTFSDENPFTITYYDSNDEIMSSHGKSLRDCVKKAIAKEIV